MPNIGDARETGTPGPRDREEGPDSSDASQGSNKRQKTSAVSLPLWLVSPDSNADLNSLPWPTTCPAARIEDRSSVFIGYVYPLTNASNASISALLSHLSRIVHPTIPVDQLPPQFRNSASSRRGSTQDMYAFRVMQLKAGRNGMGGPSDFGTAQGVEDDGEKWGGDRVMRAVRNLGASDVLVIVSRWYGGELLGPVRFEHIERAAHAALQQHMDDEVRPGSQAIALLRTKLQALDKKIANARGRSYAENPYPNLTLERGRRLLIARNKSLESVARE